MNILMEIIKTWLKLTRFNTQIVANKPTIQMMWMICVYNWQYFNKMLPITVQYILKFQCFVVVYYYILNQDKNKTNLKSCT